jgi:transcriptional pleiotropic regulator of transition state genes
MENSHKIKKIDNLGRIVIPRNIRKALDIKDWDDLYVELSDNSIVITKARNSCALCGNEEELVSVENRFVCKKCLALLKKI